MINNQDVFDGCEYQIGLDFFRDWGIDVDTYIGADAAAVASPFAKFPYRYDTKQLYGFCVPSLDNLSGSASAMSDQMINTFKKLF